MDVNEKFFNYANETFFNVDDEAKVDVKDIPVKNANGYFTKKTAATLLGIFLVVWALNKWSQRQ